MNPKHSSRWGRTFRRREGKRHQLRLRLEQLESRYLLAGDLGSSAEVRSDPVAVTWFETIDRVPRIEFGSLSSVDPDYPDGFQGPRELATGEWIVQLTDQATRGVYRLAAADQILDAGANDFSIISGLGAEGLILVRAVGVSAHDIEASLHDNEAVESFSQNMLITGQATTPNDPEYGSLLPGLDEINVSAAWDQSTGSSEIVVGVVDGGIDATHPDLFLNIWLNQGEIPSGLRDVLQDTDNDGLITFYDLNNLKRVDGSLVVASTGVAATVAELTTDTPWDHPDAVNKDHVRDLNRNGRIDALDLLDDDDWADAEDTDRNGFFDDFFGVNFRAGGDDPFLDNVPGDEYGHGTHVSGTIGAVGNNGLGVSGVNWQTSLMSLRILDNANQSDAGSAIRAINYARSMRESLRRDNGRVTEGADVRVLNNSWGQPGGYQRVMELAIRDLGDEDVLFVAAAGNGNRQGEGVNNDQTPFYPAGYDADNVIAVAALGPGNELWTRSNYGASSVDLAAPGVGIRSTVPGGGWLSQTGTSMAAPHVSGAAALIWSDLPGATASEVKDAILQSAEQHPIVGGTNRVATGGRLDSAFWINADIFTPTAELGPPESFIGATAEFEVTYRHRDKIDVDTIGDDDIVVTREWGPPQTLSAALKPGSITPATDAAEVTATYVIDAPGGSWDALDFGDYRVATVPGSIADANNKTTIVERNVGSFRVQIDDPTVLYVNRFDDSLDPGSLRHAIIAANAAAPESRTIILDSGTYTLSIPPVVDPADSFGTAIEALGIENPGGWNGETSGDLDIRGQVTILGDVNDDTVIDAQELDRVLKIHPGGSLRLERITIQNGVSPASQGGGGILSAGDLNLDQAIVKANVAVAVEDIAPSMGGGIAAWGGAISISEVWVTDNNADFGGGVYLGGAASGSIQRSTVDNNHGGGVHSYSDEDVNIENSTFSANVGGYGAISNGVLDGEFKATNVTTHELSADGRYVVIASASKTIVPNDTNNASDIFVHDLMTGANLRVSVSESGIEGNGSSFSPVMSGNGRFIAFSSSASNLVSGDTNGTADIFIYDVDTRAIERIVTDTGEQGNDRSYSPSISDDGRFVAFVSRANNLVPSDTNFVDDIFLYDRQTKTLERINVRQDGASTFDPSRNPAISGNGRYVAFESLTPLTDILHSDYQIYRFDRIERTMRLVSKSVSGEVAFGSSEEPSITRDGRFVCFWSYGNNLVPANTFGADVFVYDADTGEIEWISKGIPGLGYANSSFDPRITADGRFVSYVSLGSNLDFDDNNNDWDLFVHDRTNSWNDRVSIDASGYAGRQSDAVLSSDGSHLMFQSDVDVVSGFAAGSFDLFLHNRSTEETEPVLYQAPKSLMTVQHATIAQTSDVSLNAPVIGNVDVRQSLFVLNEGVLDIRARIAPVPSSNLFSITPNVERVTPLERTGSLPPIHRLIAGNPAIDAASMSTQGSYDQLYEVRSLPDFGAVEATTGALEGSVFLDANRNGYLDAGEMGLANVPVTITGVVTQVLHSETDDTATSRNESGRLIINHAPPGTYSLDVESFPGWSVSRPQLDIVRNRTVSSDGSSDTPSLSADGRFIAFNSSANNFADADHNELQDVFVFDRVLRTVERISETNNGGELNAPSTLNRNAISGDGQIVVFESSSPLLYPEEITPGTEVDVFLRDQISSRTDLLTLNALRVASDNASISTNGKYIVFHSIATDLVQGDNSGLGGVFVYELATGEIERASWNEDDAPVHGSDPSISGDGRFVAYTYLNDVFLHDRRTRQTKRITSHRVGTMGIGSSSSPSINADGSIVAFISSGEIDYVSDGAGGGVFVYDRVHDTFERISRSDEGIAGVGNRMSPTVSGDGRFVAFVSDASNLVPSDQNFSPDVFVFDRTKKLIRRVSTTAEGVEVGNSFQHAVSFYDPISISADGRFIAFSSSSDELIELDNNNSEDVFVVSNPLAPAATKQLGTAEFYKQANVGLVPNRGLISGRVFGDIVPNLTYDTGEPNNLETIIFLDADGDRVLDDGERTATPDSEGRYEFADIDGYQYYSVVATSINGFQQVIPNELPWDIFLPAGGQITGRDFAFREVVSTGQSSNSSVSVRVEDAAGNPLEGIRVFLDSNDSGTKESNERALESDAAGNIVFDGLGTGTFAVRTLFRNDEELVHVSPLGSALNSRKTPAIGSTTIDSKPQAIELADFNGDLYPDAAIALPASDTIVIRINDKQGGFTDQVIKLDPTPESIGADLVQAGPIALAVGNFNGLTDGAPKLDLAVVNNFRNSVLVLTDFNGSGFDQSDLIGVGEKPIDIATVTIGGDALHQHLAIVNSGDHTLQVLKNDGTGNFVAQTAIPSGGFSPTALAVGDFGGGSAFELAVVNFASPSNVFGNVQIFAGDANGLVTQVSPAPLLVQGGPTDIVAADFDGDLDLDLAVANAASGTVSVLVGNGDGSFTTQDDTKVLGDNRGLTNLATGDIDNDGDIDLIAGDSLNFDVLIFRNRTQTPNEPSFEPSEARGLGQIAFAESVPIAVANFDRDDSGPGGQGTMDIIAVATERVGTTLLPTAMLQVLSNQLIDGAVRIETDGINPASDVTFVIEPKLLPPSLAAIESIAIDEDDGLQTIPLSGIAKGRPGGPDLRFSASSSDTTLIASAVVDHTPGESTAVLRFSSLANAVGTAILSVTVTDAGANGIMGDSDDAAVTRLFTVNIRPVNDPPEFELLPLVSATQKAGVTARDSVVTNVTPGGGNDENMQEPGAFEVTAANAGLFSVQPQIDSQGRLTFTPDPNKSGVSLVSVRLSDDGGVERGGIDTTTKSFVIHVTPVNDPPSITLGGDLLVAAGAGPQMHADFATNFDPGPSDDDAAQVLADFVVSVDQAALFRTLPDISNDGTLTFTPAVDVTGTAEVTVQARDNGGTADGGVDLSAAQSFTITVAGAPQVESVVINAGSSSRSQVTSLTVHFSDELDHAELTSAFTLTNIDTGVQVGSLDVAASTADGRTSTVLTFSGTSTVTRGVGNSLADGNYRLDVKAARVIRAGGGITMADDYQFGGHTASEQNNDDFFRLYGDTDGDGDVDGQDYGRFGSAFLSQSGQGNFDTAFDFDGDGDVDGQDYGQLGLRFLKQRR